MKPSLALVLFATQLVACGRKSAPAITADPSATSAPSTSPRRSDSAKIYAVVLHDHLAPFLHHDMDRLTVIDMLFGPPCGTPEQLSSSLPTAHSDTLAAWARVSAGQPLEHFSTALPVDFKPFETLPTATETGSVAWPAGGAVAFTQVAFDGARSDALVGLLHWHTPGKPTFYVIHLVLRDAAWKEQELLRCP